MRIIGLLVVIVMMAFAPPPKKKVRIYLIGDSTMCEYDAKRAPITGWGMPFRYFFDSSEVEIDNRARGGRSTRTFLSEGRWQPITDSLQEGDYVLMQFGHNDEAKEEKYKDRYTPVADYKTNLIKFITESRAKKATPVLITPVSRMRFKDGVAQETHVEYTAAVLEVAKEQNVPVIDLDKMSRQLYQQMGEEDTKLLFMQLAVDEHPSYPEGQKDNTHFNEFGARKIAQLVLKGLLDANVGLVNYVVKPAPGGPSRVGITNIPDTSYTNYSAYNSIRKQHPYARLVPDSATKNVKEKRNIEYCKIAERKLLLDVFYPADKSKKKRTAIMIIHGGGWRTGNRTQHHALAQRLAALGYVSFTPEYRLSTEALYPAAVYDLKAALQWIHKEAKSYGIDTAKIAVAGFSAGGQLAALLGTTNGNAAFESKDCYPNFPSTVNAIIDLDGTLSFVHPESGEADDSKRTSASTYWFGYSKKANYKLLEDASPLTHVSKHTPPTLFINSSVARMHAGRDDFMKVLKENKIYTEVKTFENAPHHFPMFEPWFSPMVDYVDAFLKKVFER